MRALLFVESNTSGTGRLFIRAAREMGFAPVLVTARPEKYAFLAAADAPEVLAVPEVSEDALEPVFRARFGAEGIGGITSSSEYFIATAAALAARFGLPGPDAPSVRAARDKSVQRRVLSAAGLPSPAFRVCASADEAAAAAREIGGSVVVKPTGGSGSVGVRLCADADEAAAHAATLLADAASAGENPRVLVEALVDGPEFSAEVFNGRVVGLTRKHLGAPPSFVEAGHDYPAAVPAPVARALEDTAVRGTALLGLGWGPLHWEMRMRGGETVPIEVNPRLAGGFIPELVRHAQGIDLIRETLKLVAGQAADPAPAHHRHASIRFLFSPGDGRLDAAEGVEAARSIAGVEEVTLYRAPGDRLEIRGDFRDRIGHVIAAADSFAAACTAAERGRDAVRIVLAEPAAALQEVG
jgi:argininosuccinate lyase